MTIRNPFRRSEVSLCTKNGSEVELSKRNVGFKSKNGGTLKASKRVISVQTADGTTIKLRPNKVIKSFEKCGDTLRKMGVKIKIKK